MYIETCLTHYDNKTISTNVIFVHNKYSETGRRFGPKIMYKFSVHVCQIVFLTIQDL